jgi:glycosyltransferase involved in cell wall biosynthesis
MFDREIALYQKYQERGIKVSFVTYGDEHDLQFAHRIPGIEILCNKWRKWGLNWRIYATLIPLLHASTLRKADVIKTNQMLGADIALRAARMWNKPLISRCGYMFSDHVARQYGDGSSRAIKARKLEQHVFKSADRIIVTTDQIRADIELGLPDCHEKIDVIPNYVETDRFFPTDAKKERDILFIGRLANQKNPTTLLEAAKKVKAQIVVIGNGPLEKELKENYGNMNGRLEWKGNIPNSELPGYMNRSKIFVLPSHYEGHPKTLIEAMSCGMPVIGADSLGIREIIRHGENGWLCGTDVESIGQAIRKLLKDPALAQRIGDNARQFVLQNCTLEDIVEKELKVIKEVAMVEN